MPNLPPSYSSKHLNVVVGNKLTLGSSDGDIDRLKLGGSDEDAVGLTDDEGN